MATAVFLLLLILGAIVFIRVLHNKKNFPGNRNAAPNAVEAVKPPSGDTAGSLLEQLVALKEKAKNTERQLTMIYGLLDDGSLDRAQELMNQLRSVAPDGPVIHRVQALIYLGKKDYQPAARELIAALSMMPENWDNKMGLSRALLAMKEYEAALVVSEWMLEEQPYSVEARCAAASAGLNLDRTSQAVLHLKKVMEMDSDNREARQMLSDAYRKQGDYDKAIKLLSDQLAEDERDSLVYYKLAVCYASMNDAEGCLNWLRKASTLFGHSFVNSWVNAAEFDNVKTNAAFVAFFMPPHQPPAE